MQAKVHGSSGSLELTDSLFGAKFNEPLVHQVVAAYLAAGRSGTKAQKRRSDVRGGGIKPWRQKGTGRARAGTSRSPIWVGGGRAFAAAPRNFSQKVNRKMYRGALRSILSELLRQQRILFAEQLALDAPKTKELVGKLRELGFAGGLLVVEAFDEKIWLAARNLPHVSVAEAGSVDPVSLVAAEQIVLTAAAAKVLEERIK